MELTPNILKLLNKAFSAARQKQVTSVTVGYSLQPNNKKTHVYPTAEDWFYLNSEEIMRLLSADMETIAAFKELYNAIDSCTELTPEVLLRAKQAIDKAAK